MALDSFSECKIAIVKNDKDIGRLVLRRKEDGKYDLKITIQNLPYKIQKFRLFALRPQVGDITTATPTELSYHPGFDGKPIRIHVKHMNSSKGDHPYPILEGPNIIAPSINHTFPIPLLKLEIPNSVIQNAKNYKRKSKHKSIIDLKNANVIEIFMLSEESFRNGWEQKYEYLEHMITMMPLEFFSAGCVNADYQKFDNWYPTGKEPVNRQFSFSAGEVRLYVNVFPSRYISFKEQLTLSFIENAYAEDFLLNSCLVLSNSSSQKAFGVNEIIENPTLPSMCESFAIGGTNFRKYIKLSDEQINRIPQESYNIVKWTVHNNSLLTEQEKDTLISRFYESRLRLAHKFKQFTEEADREKHELLEKCVVFETVLYALHNEALAQNPTNKTNRSILDIDAWFLSNPYLQAFPVQLLLAKWLGKDSCTICRLDIHPDSSIFKTPDNLIIHHDFLLYSDLWDIDLFHKELNNFLDEKNAVPNSILIHQGKHPARQGSNLRWLLTKLQENHCRTQYYDPLYIDQIQFNDSFQNQNKLLTRVYNRIVEKARTIHANLTPCTPSFMDNDKITFRY